jgi:hypothetical protein
MPQTGDQPEHRSDQDDRQDDLTEEKYDSGERPEYPVRDENAYDSEHRHSDGVPESHRLPIAPGFYVSAHKPDATFPPCPLMRHFVTGGAACSPNQD